MERVSFLLDTGSKELTSLERMKEILLRGVSFFPPYEVIGITSIVMLAFFLRVTRILTPPFASDESIYSYASYAISQGVIPYREIELAHPPFMYLIYAMFIRLTGPNLLYLRLLTIGITLAIIFLVYLMVKVVLSNQKESGKLGLLSAGIYAFYPIILWVTSQLEAILTLFTLLSVIVYAKFYNSKNKTLLLLTGILIGCALMTKLPAIFFIAPILLCHMMYGIGHKEYKRIFVDIPIILLGVAVPLAFTLVWLIFYCGALPQFYMQIYQWQLIRPPQMLWERQSNIFWYVNAFLPLIVIGALGALYSIKIAKEQSNYLIILPTLLYGANVLAFLTISRFILFHYFIYLSPYLIFLNAVYLNNISQMLKKKPKISVKPDFILQVGSLILVFAVLLQSLIYSVPFVTARTGELITPFNANPYTKVEHYIGNYVAAITNPSDKIWTSEGAIAFFAQRTITTPNSSNWPFQAFFSDVFGVVSPNQFVQGWEKDKTKVIILIRGDGWIPYPDEILWYGFSNQQGVAGYIQEKYVFEKFVTASGVPYTYEIWVRK